MYIQNQNQSVLPSPASTSRSLSPVMQDRLPYFLNTPTDQKESQADLPDVSISASPTSTSTSTSSLRDLRLKTHKSDLPSPSSSSRSLNANQKLYSAPSRDSHRTSSISSKGSSAASYPIQNNEMPPLEPSSTQDLFAYVGVQFDAELTVPKRVALAEFEASCYEILQHGGEVKA